MRADELDPRRCVPVRLVDIPLKKRLQAARAAAKYEVDADARRELLAAALFPSSQTYWIAA